MRRAMFLANLIATIVAVLCVVVLVVKGVFLAPTVVDRLLLGAGLIAIPLLLIWCPIALGEAPPAWISKQTPWPEAYLMGWCLLLGICLGSGIVLWVS